MGKFFKESSAKGKSKKPPKISTYRKKDKKWRNVPKMYKKAAIKETMMGAAIGATLGAASAEKSKGKSALKGAVAGGMAGASVGFARKGARAARDFGNRQRRANQQQRNQQQQQNYRRSQGTFKGNIDDDLKVLGVKNKSKIKTKKEVKIEHRRKAMKHHPDRGGDPDKMSKVNASWERVSNSSWYEKLAFWMQKLGQFNG